MFRYIRQAWTKPVDTYTKVVGPPIVAFIGYGCYQTFANNNTQIRGPVTNMYKPNEKNRKVGS